MKSFFFKGVFLLFAPLKHAINLCCAARGHALAVWLRLVPRRPNSLRPGATYLSLLLSFAINSNIAQTQQLSNRKYIAHKTKIATANANNSNQRLSNQERHPEYVKKYYQNHGLDHNNIANYQYYQFRGGITKRNLNYIPLNEIKRQETNQEIRKKEEKKQLKQSMQDVVNNKNTKIQVSKFNQTNISNATDLKLLQMQNKYNKKRVANKTTKSENKKEK